MPSVAMEPSHSNTSRESNWPGERDPSRHDVHVANELPEPAFLSEFKRTLLASSDATGNLNLMHLDLQLNEQGKYTYPVSLLSDFPSNLPPENEVALLREIFSKCCSGHTFLNRLPIPPPSREPVALPLPLAIACLASVHARHDPAEARNLFLASRGLWGSIMEVDNREARSLDLLMAAIFCCVYGALSSDETIWDRARPVLCSAMTIARRMRCHDPKQFEHLLGSPAPSYSGAFIWCLWLVDILHALHSDLSVITFTSRELWTTMPSSSLEFQEVYQSLLGEKMPHNALPTEVASQDDALLLLMAVVSDLLYLRGSLGQMVRLGHSMIKQSTRRNPFIPLSPRIELERMENLLSLALDRWHERFHARVPLEIVAFYHYCRMYFSCDRLLDLPHIARHKPWKSEPVSSTDFSISDKAIHQAWLVLANAAARPKLPSVDTLCPVWLPIVVFHAGLLVWAKHSLDGTRHGEEYGSAKILLAFKIELEGMSWPCCKEMAATLERLMAISTPRQWQ